MSTPEKFSTARNKMKMNKETIRTALLLADYQSASKSYNYETLFVLALEGLKSFNKGVADANGFFYRPYVDGHKIDIDNMLLQLPDGTQVNLTAKDAGYMLERGFKHDHAVIYVTKENLNESE